ncbi:MAG: type II secretion system F family protein [Firmicutes bacterium]|nr:type II secretion system F family protein [Bacillota bacterium]
MDVTHILILVPVTLFLIFYSIMSAIGSARKRAVDRIAKYIRRRETTAFDMELNRSLSDRLFMPIYKKLSNAVSRMIPRNHLEALSVSLYHSGLRMSPQEFMTLQLGTTVIIPSVLAFVLYRADYGIDEIMAISILFAAAGYLLPKYILISRINRRKNMIRRELPGMIDLLTVSMEAGLSFDMALTKIVSKSSGLLAEQLGLAINKIRRGIPRSQALREMAQKVDVDELTNFIRTVLQAEKLGISISNILRVQATQMREAKKQWAREKGGKAAVKIIIPLVVFIMPVLFVVLIGPLVLNAMEYF